MTKRNRKSKKKGQKKPAKTTGSPRRSTYEPLPNVTDPVAQRAELVLAIMYDELTVSDAARLLGISRVQMQTIKNRGLRGLMEGVTPRPGGRPGKDEATKLREELEEAQEEIQRLEGELAASRQVITELVDLVKKQAADRKPRSRRSRSRTKTQDDDDDARMRLARAQRLVGLGADPLLAARAVLASPSTVRRWAARMRRNEPLVRRRGPGPKRPPRPRQRRRAEARVRELNGSISAAALGRAAGISRRDAYAIKRETLTTMERERKQAAARVELAQPGLMRSLDAMHLRAVEGRAYALIMADAAVPYRTSAALVDRYDSPAVERVIAADFDQHGEPLVLRLDRASCQRTPAVHRLLRERRVLHLHGPPRHPQYYGQLERQNREHRAVLGDDVLTKRQLAAKLGPMTAALNDRLPRRSLDWRTAGESWRLRQPIDVDRDELRDEVTRRAARIQQASPKRLDHEVAWRFAVERTLIKRGLLRIKPGGGC